MFNNNYNKNCYNIIFTSLFFIGALFLCVILSSGCIFSTGDNGNGDDDKPEKPAIVSVSIFDGQIIISRDITITWEGNKSASYFQYTLDDVVYDVTADTTVTLTDLEESEHVFTIQAFDDSLAEKSSPDSITFTIDAIKGPGIVFSPRKITIEPIITIFLEDVSHLMAAHIEIVCENRCVLFGEFTKNKSLTGNGEVISITGSSTLQRFILDIAFAGETEGLSGSLINIGTITIIPMREGSIIIDPDRTVFRDIHNETIVINDLDYARVVR